MDASYSDSQSNQVLQRAEEGRRNGCARNNCGVDSCNPMGKKRNSGSVNDHVMEAREQVEFIEPVSEKMQI